jgi:hypothetical protein
MKLAFLCLIVPSPRGEGARRHQAAAAPVGAVAKAHSMVFGSGFNVHHPARSPSSPEKARRKHFEGGNTGRWRNPVNGGYACRKRPSVQPPAGGRSGAYSRIPGKINRRAA